MIEQFERLMVGIEPKSVLQPYPIDIDEMSHRRAEIIRELISFPDAIYVKGGMDVCAVTEHHS